MTRRPLIAALAFAAGLTSCAYPTTRDLGAGVLEIQVDNDPLGSSPAITLATFQDEADKACPAGFVTLAERASPAAAGGRIWTIRCVAAARPSTPN